GTRSGSRAWRPRRSRRARCSPSAISPSAGRVTDTRRVPRHPSSDDGSAVPWNAATSSPRTISRASEMRWHVSPASDSPASRPPAPPAGRRALGRLPQADIFFTPEYHRVYEGLGSGRAMAFTAEDDGELLFYPFLLRPIDAVAEESLQRPYYDIETVRGQS